MLLDEPVPVDRFQPGVFSTFVSLPIASFAPDKLNPQGKNSLTAAAGNSGGLKFPFLKYHLERVIANGIAAGVIAAGSGGPAVIQRLTQAVTEMLAAGQLRNLPQILPGEQVICRIIATAGDLLPGQAKMALTIDKYSPKRPAGAPAEVVLLSRDITDLKALEAILEQEGTRDELTGLHNRRYLMERLEPALRSAKRYGHPLSFCLCDLDRFKAVNEEHGRAAGDEILKAFGFIARKELRAEDLAARYGGDEFAFLFPFIPAQDAAISLERIRERLRAKDFCGRADELFRVTATFGVTNLEPGHAHPRDLFEAADRVLFHAKDLGRDRVLVARAP